jgi:hypothetical protein
MFVIETVILHTQKNNQDYTNSVWKYENWHITHKLVSKQGKPGQTQ